LADKDPEIPVILTLVAGCSLLIPAIAGLLLTGVPTRFCPLPALTALPAMFLMQRLAVIVPTFLFFLWQPGLFKGDSQIPRRTYALVSIVFVLSVFWFIAGWKWGLQYQGIQHVRFVCLANTAWVAFLGLAFARSEKHAPSFKSNLFLHWILFVWLAWYAFPYLGELP
jgi:hypothetical protein